MTGPTAVIEGETFRDEDWYGEELTDREYRNCLFSRVDLTEAATRGVTFTECAFDNVRLNASRHADSAFLRCTFKRSNLFEAEFTGCKLIGSGFEECSLRPLSATGGDWSFVTLSGADLRGVTLRGVRMREADLAGADLTDAVLADADLSGAQLRGAKLLRCDLRGSDLSALDPGTVELAGAVISAEQAIVVAQALGLDVR
jgi:uncharacterized protein YjbI with pentapeptide repeats